MHKGWFDCLIQYKLFTLSFLHALVRVLNIWKDEDWLSQPYHLASQFRTTKYT